jgi:hypothetical protein
MEAGLQVRVLGVRLLEQVQVQVVVGEWEYLVEVLQVQPQQLAAVQQV